jgi:hypothetical protein
VPVAGLWAGQTGRKLETARSPEQAKARKFLGESSEGDRPLVEVARLELVMQISPGREQWLTEHAAYQVPLTEEAA